jgi:hypothetical protein
MHEPRVREASRLDPAGREQVTMQRLATGFVLFAVLCGSLGPTSLHADVPFRIQVVDEQTGRGVPLVELKTVNNVRYYTDSQGVAAIDEPGLMGLDVFFHVKTHGYEYPKDGFGYRGKALKLTAGGSAVLKIKRINIAERLYRLTGSGIYRDSVLAGLPVPIKEPLLNGQVFGCDATMSAVYRGALYWFWGDTNRPQYPLGNFHVTGATSRLPDKGGLDPAIGVDLEIFTGKDGFARPMAKLPGEGATWLGSLIVLSDPQTDLSNEKTGGERMFASYVRVKPPFVTDRYGLAEFDDKTTRFRSVADFGRDPVIKPMGHPIRLRDGRDDYIYYGTTIPFIRVPARAESLMRLESYEAYTCLRPGSRLDKREIDRAADGTVRYGWKKNTPPVSPEDEQAFIKPGFFRLASLKPHEGLFQFRDRDTGRPILAHFGSCYWNEYRQRFVLIFVQSGGDTSYLGEVWYAEGDSPLGPWVYAVKIVTHDRYSFYNPKQHSVFAQQGGRVIYFDGTYANTFAGNPDQTPRYDYNLIMYRLDLGDPRLALPVAIYRAADSGALAARRTASPAEAVAPPDRSRIAFFAFDRPGGGRIPVYAEAGKRGRLSLEPNGEAGARRIAFYALPPNSNSPPAATVPLYECTADDGRLDYSVNPATELPGFRRNEKPLYEKPLYEKPLCRVWKTPFLPL